MEPEAIFESVDADALERYGVTALAIGVDGHERGYSVPPETTFRVASITKAIVAATAMRLVEEGRLALDEPLTGLRLPWQGSRSGTSSRTRRAWRTTGRSGCPSTAKAAMRCSGWPRTRPSAVRSGRAATSPTRTLATGSRAR